MIHWGNRQVRDIQPGPSRRRQARQATARERIDHAAYELFCRHGIRGTGMDAVSARAGVTKMTVYRYYPSKDHLALAFLRRREELWSRGWLQRQVEDRALDPRERLLAIFDVLDKWFRRSTYEGCPFITPGSSTAAALLMYELRPSNISTMSASFCAGSPPLQAYATPKASPDNGRS